MKKETGTNETDMKEQYSVYFYDGENEEEQSVMLPNELQSRKWTRF